MSQTIYDVAIIGAGASGAALLYTLSHYTNLSSILLLEKYPEPGAVNSNAKNNSQTLHVGDIETNYSLEKVKQVKPGAEMVLHYIKNLPREEQTFNGHNLLEQVQKMVLAVGEKEVATLEQRFNDLKAIFPTLQKLNREQIAGLEPEVINGRPENEPILALYNPEGYAVNFGLLAHSLIKNSSTNHKTITAKFNTELKKITPVPEKHLYQLITDQQTFVAKIVVVCTDAYSLGLAKSLGLGQEFSLIPVAGSFYFSRPLLNGKVYTVQEPRLPFAAVHGDPDLTKADATRWGPTARFFPVLESGKLRTMPAYFRASGLGKLPTWISFFKILSEPIRAKFLLKNLFFEFPIIGKFLFARSVQKITPSIRAKDLQKAKNYGGMRLQRVNINTSELLLGEGKILGENIIFNMTPSPGASVCLYNAMRDAEQILKFTQNPNLKLKNIHFDKTKMQHDLKFTS